MEITNSRIISNEKIDEQKLRNAAEIILNLQKDIPSYTEKGAGPFMAAIYNDAGELIVKAVNSVVAENCSINHAEINAIKAAEKVFKTYDLSPYNLSIYISAEPCMMCLGAILWSGIKNVYYGVSSKRVEEITGFDEGFKPDWLKEFKMRGITVYGNIEALSGEIRLREYVKNGNKIYKPSVF